MRYARPIVVLAASAAAVVVSVNAASPVAAWGSTSSANGWKASEVGLGHASDINERGQIIGGYRVETIMWTGKKRRTLTKAPIPDADEYAHAINDTGEVVGAAWGGVGVEIDALLWQRNGALRILPPLRTKYSSEAWDINNSGQIVGWSGDVAVVWESGRPQALPGRRGVARAINDRGLVVGSVGARAALWENGTLRVLATTKSDATDINNRGHVVGWRTGAAGKVRRGFLWDNGAMVDLGGFMPEAINNRGQIVGSCISGACVWQRGRITNLPDLGYSDAIATGINERQQIVGYAQDRGLSLLVPHVLVWTFRR